MKLYSAADLESANRQLRRYAIRLGAGLAVLLGLYGFMLALRQQGAMLALLIAAYVYAASVVLFYLRPAARYRAFLRDMNAGLSRETVCTVEGIDPGETVQDGVRVRIVRIRSSEDGEERLMYLNVSKPEAQLKPGETLTLASFGRHITGVSRTGA